MLKNIKVISFDLDDTLWNGTQVLIHAEKSMTQWMDQHTPKIASNLNRDELRTRKIQFIKNNPSLKYKVSDARQLFLAQLFSEFDYPQAEVLAADCFSHFYNARQKVTLFDDVRTVLDKLNQHFKIIAITNGNANIEMVGLSKYFDFCLNAEDFALPKPHGDIFKEALAQANVSAGQCLHVGDHPVHDMQGAKEAGMKTCWLEDGKRPWQLPFNADITITHVRDLLPLLEL